MVARISCDFAGGGMPRGGGSRIEGFELNGDTRSKGRLNGRIEALTLTGITNPSARARAWGCGGLEGRIAIQHVGRDRRRLRGWRRTRTHDERKWYEDFNGAEC